MMQRARVVAWLSLAVAVLIPASQGVYAERQARVPLQELERLSGLQSLFDREADKVRVVMLLSPT